MRYIVVIDGVKSSRYKYNVWSVFEYGCFAPNQECSQDVRLFATDDVEEFALFVKTLEGEE